MASDRPQDSSYSVRPGRPDDGEDLLRVHRDAILQLGTAAYSEAETESWCADLVAEGYGRAMTEEGEIFLVAVDATDRVIGFCSHRDDEIMALYVHPDRVRRGIASDLLRRAEAAIAAAGHERVRVTAALVARAFYECQGYRVAETRGWRSRGGLVIEVLDMTKALA